MAARPPKPCKRAYQPLALESPSAAANAEVLAAADAVIAIGGDGTLRAAASRCLEVRGNIPPLLLIPMGTANLMGRYLGIHWLPEELAQRAIESLRNGRIVMLDAARANGKLFFVMAGIGIDAQIIHEMDRIRSGPIKYASYVVPAALALAKYRYVPLEVIVDGQTIFASAPAMAFIANISEYGTGFPVAPDARPDDGLLDVCIVPIVSLVEGVRQFFHAAAGEHILGEGVVYARGKEIEIRSAKPLPVQIDGDSAGYTPTRIDLLPIRVPFIVPV